MKKLIILMLSAYAFNNAYADKKENLAIMALSPERGSVVVRYEDNSLKVVNNGDDIPDTDFKIIQVLKDKIIAEYVDSKRNEHADIDQVWIYKLTAGAKTSKLEYVRNFRELDKEVIQEAVEAIDVSLADKNKK